MSAVSEAKVQEFNEAWDGPLSPARAVLILETPEMRAGPVARLRYDMALCETLRAAFLAGWDAGDRVGL